MQDIRRLQVLLLAALFVVGCADSRQAAARKKLEEEIDTAKRQLASVSGILANPVVIDRQTRRPVPTTEVVVLKPGSKLYSQVGDRVAGEVTLDGKVYKVKTRSGEELEIRAADVVDVRQFKPTRKDIEYPPYIGDPNSDAEPLKEPDVITSLASGQAVRAARPEEAGKLLDQAREGLLAALSECADAPPSTRAHAQQLLANIESARAQSLTNSAMLVRAKVVDRHAHARARIDVARNQGIVADYHRALGKAPRQKLRKLRDDTRQRLTAQQRRIKAIDTKIGSLNAQIAQLAEENERLLATSRKLRAQSELANGRERLTKLHQAHDEERKANANTAKADAARDDMANLKVDKQLAAEAARAAQAELNQLAQRLAEMDTSKKLADQATLDASDEADRAARDVHKIAAEALVLDAEALALEQRALKALDEAATQLGAAARDVKAGCDAARKAQRRQPKLRTGLLEGMADQKHLAMVLGSKASAHLMMGELRSEALAGAADNAALAKRIADLASQLGVTEPGIVAKLRAAGTIDPAVKEHAVQDYVQAEKDFNAVLSSHLKGTIGTNIQWMYQGRLANAYLGHYRLTGDASVLSQAKTVVDQAAAGKAESPHLASVYRLKAVIDAATAN